MCFATKYALYTVRKKAFASGAVSPQCKILYPEQYRMFLIKRYIYLQIRVQLTDP